MKRFHRPALIGNGSQGFCTDCPIAVQTGVGKCGLLMVGGQISLVGGVIQDIQLPRGISVVVRDYDVDGVEEGLQQDEDGDQYIESVWE